MRAWHTTALILHQLGRLVEVLTYAAWIGIVLCMLGFGV